MQLQGKSALVTGGAHRVGKAISLWLGRAGANVAVNYNQSAEAAQDTVAEIRRLGGRALAVHADIADPSRVAAMFEAITDEFGGLDVLVNSASGFRKTPIPMDDFTDWHYMIDVQINGSFYTSNAAAKVMLAQGAGVIVNILDLAIWQPWHGFTAHSVGKAGLLAMTRQLALELAPNIRVNAVAPGYVLPPDYLSEERIAQMASGTLLNRWGTPEDVAQAVQFLVEADYITGEVIRVDGGESIAKAKRDESDD